MRTLRDLDDQIGRAERRLAARREHLNESLENSRARTRVSLASPKVLAAAFVTGFVLERLGRLRPRGGRQRQASSGAGIAAGLAAAALRSALGNPKLWDTVRGAWKRRTAGYTRRPVQPVLAWEKTLPGARDPGVPGGSESAPPSRPAYGSSSATAAHR
jgi:hypothetical protein